MSVNMGMIDRALRLIVGLGLIAFALGYVPGFETSDYRMWGWIGIVPVLTAFIGFCPAYTLIGVNTCGRS